MPQPLAVQNTNSPKATPSGVDVARYDFSDGGSRFLFGRQWAVKFGNPIGTQGAFDLVVKYDELRTVFEIEKNSTFNSNKAKVHIYNLNDASRKRYVKGMVLSLDAGYSQPVNIFTGNISGLVNHERKGPDIISTFECGDGEKNLITATINKNWPVGYEVSLIVQDLIAAAGFPTRYISPLIATFKTKGAFTATSTVQKALGDLLTGLVGPSSPKGFVFQIEGGAIQILPAGGSILTTANAIEVSAKTGLIGVPGVASGGDNVLKFTTLLNPKLFPGTLIHLTSKIITGFFVVRKVAIEGDSHGPKWQMSCDCAPPRKGQTGT